MEDEVSLVRGAKVLDESLVKIYKVMESLELLSGGLQRRF